ncbi:restriction endonuclease subunit S [Tuanshanicoccus yangjingiae]|uniref:restriction endonuclease subunit S n=1 Tax=Aerococcaceae bacterium zg-252 TaxID=2796928 RepID=UPI004062E750
MSNDVIIYNTDDGKAQIELHLDNGTVWLTQAELAELFQTSKQKERLVMGTKVIELYPKNLAKIKIPLPPKKIQVEIVQILDKFTEYVTELTFRKQQYSYHRDKLLSFENEVYEVEWKTLGEVLVKGRGTKITAGQMKDLHKEGAPIRIFAGGKTFADVNYGDIPDKDVHTETSIIVKSRGIIDFEYYTKPFSFKNEFWSYSSDNEDINLRYVYHYLNHNKLHFQNIADNMQMLQISSNDTEKYRIPLPNKAIQSRIVQVLDNFDTICNDLKIGLPKEIEQRQKQYEYFRDKLLTFAAEGVYTDSTAQHSTAQHSTAQHSTAQHSTAQHSTAQHSTAQHSTAQHSTDKT